MNSTELLERRLTNQQLSTYRYSKPHEMVSWLSAVQSQDFSGAMWALSQRLNFLGKKQIEEAYNDGKILRTHVLRPTWHFVCPEDLIWMVELSAERVKKMMGTYNKALGLDEEIFQKSEIIIINALKNANYLNREELGKLLKSNGIEWKGNGLAHIVMMAELNTVICSGPVINKHPTYALVSERISDPIKKTKEESLRELTKRYFQSHGPAQLKDYIWWSGLRTADAKKGIELNPNLKQVTVGGKSYYFFDTEFKKLSQNIYLLPNYDEYTVAFRDREVLTQNVDKSKLDFRQNSLFNNVILIDGKIEGVWRRTLTTKAVRIETHLFKELSKQEMKELNLSFGKYAEFLQLELQHIS